MSASPKDQERKATHDAIIMAAQILGGGRDGGWGMKSPFRRLCGEITKQKFSPLRPRRTNCNEPSLENLCRDPVARTDKEKRFIKLACDRIHAAFHSVLIAETFVGAAWAPTVYRISKVKQGARKARGATSFPRRMQDDYPDKFPKDVQRLFRHFEFAERDRLHPANADVLKHYLGKQHHDGWATVFLGQALAHAFEDITGNSAGTISSDCERAGDPTSYFRAFLGEVLRIAADAILHCDQATQKCWSFSQETIERAAETLAGLSPPRFRQSMDTFENYPREVWNSHIGDYFRMIEHSLFNRPRIPHGLPKERVNGTTDPDADARPVAG